MNPRSEVARRRDEALARQLRVAAWLAIVVIAHLALTSVLFGAPTYPIDYWLRPIALALSIAVLLALRSPRVLPYTRHVALFFSAALCLAPTVSGAVGGDFEGNAVLVGVIALGASALFPWGGRFQFALAAALLTMLLVTAFSISTGDLSTARSGVMNAVTAALLMSVLIATRTRRLFEADVRENVKLREAQAQIHALNTGLEETVRERTGELEVALGDQRSFTYAVSHDLRQPLRHVDGYMRMIEESASPRLNEEERSLLRRVYRALERAGRMIDALLELSRIGNDSVRREPLDVSRIAERVASDLRRREPGREVTVEIQPGLEAQGDPELVYSLFERLLENAWKFTRDSTDARIEIARDDDGAFVVRDNGVGFDMKFASKLFGTFQRLHGAEEFAGEGIGLALAQRVVRHHGGTIEAVGAPGEGATIRFTLGASAGQC